MELFANKGFHATSVRAICSQAQANLCSVNYHFGSKQALYEAVVRDLFGQLRAQTQGLHRTAADPLSWRKALAEWVRLFLSAMLSDQEPAKWTARLCSRELSDPSPISGHLFADVFVPILDELRRLVQMGLPPGSPPAREQHFVVSIVAQCVFMANHEPPWNHLVIPQDTTPAQWVADYGEHVVETSAARLAFLRNPWLDG
jgi:TetR/AcrR family transcriptional regulator, regulator of cefoperazone and chloramphenicol sensitivity